MATAIVVAVALGAAGAAGAPAFAEGIPETAFAQWTAPQPGAAAGEPDLVPAPELARPRPGRPDLELLPQPQANFQPLPRAKPRPPIGGPIFGSLPGEPIFGRRPGGPIFTPGQ